MARVAVAHEDLAMRVLFHKQEELGWTDLELAHAANTYPHYISKYRHGRKTPKFWEMVDLLEAVGVSVRFEGVKDATV